MPCRGGRGKRIPFCGAERNELRLRDGGAPTPGASLRPGLGTCGSPLAKATGWFRTRTTEESVPPHLWKHTLHSEVDATSPVSGQTLPATVFPQVANPQTDVLSSSLFFVCFPALTDSSASPIPQCKSSQCRFGNFVEMGLLVGHVGLPMLQCPDLQVILHSHENNFILQLCQRC